ncbi:receptor-like protein 6 [Ziziphus jujuba]|uniref:Receptor-like protein 6 n=1 Tax=Ziziphus jujuba TaxID=326968 RepID=A0ABM3IWU6_ZIZJJ|nr:receptor-like protein 6 [Ziziphus jujuba]
MELFSVPFPSPLSLLYIFLIIVTSSFCCVQPLCHNEESTALLQFKDSFIFHEYNCNKYPGFQPKITSWKPKGDEDCCSWDGVKCDEKSGHVIGLDLSDNCLSGSINSTSTLFQLSQLQMLNLAYNDFNYSRIPSAFGDLSRLEYLNLSNAYFYGQIPLAISQLSNLISLDLSLKIDFFTENNLLKLEKPGLSSLVRNLTKLKELDLEAVDINSEVPSFLGNLSSLTYLSLGFCGLCGQFPNAIFSLPNLQVLRLARNQHLGGYLPEFHSGSPLKEISLSETNFSGNIPSSIEKLKYLTYLEVDNCSFTGLIPASLGKLTRLTDLVLAANKFSGEIPSSLQNLTHLNNLVLGWNQLTGQLPPWLANLTQLTSLVLDRNNLTGIVPPSFFGLRNLKHLGLGGNKLSGSVDFDMFLGMKNLIGLILQENNLSVLTRTKTHNATIPKFEILFLGYCNLRMFPDFLRYQNNLITLGLRGNQLSGQIPKWMWNISLETILLIDISDNNLIGFDQSQLIIPGVSLGILDLSFNMLKGKLPIPPTSIFEYRISNNELSGEVSPAFCNLTSLKFLHLSDNKLSGVLPQCLRNVTNSMFLLDASNNSFHGNIPSLCESGSELRMIDLSHNQFEGRLPRLLPDCRMLEAVNLGDNKFHDVFPSWYGTLPELRVLILRSNRLYGVIREPIFSHEFPNLRIVDLSENSFEGTLPSEYFKIWNSMKAIDATNSSYMNENATLHGKSMSWRGEFVYSITLTNKGTFLSYGKIRDNFVFIDLSTNKFKGEIPECIGNLSGIHVLNFSHNNLSGSIPSSLGNLKELESLDLSQNKFSGEIPQQLAQLTFLSRFNVSHNFLRGSIPIGKQFDTFENSSYEGNLELCGTPLTKKCKNFETFQPPNSISDQVQDSGSSFELDWKFVAIGYCTGAVVGMVIGHYVIKKNPYLFFKTFGLRQHNGRRRRRRRT